MSGPGAAPISCFSADLVRRGAPWLRGAGRDADVVISSRVRLARNFAGAAFVWRATREQRQRTLDAARQRLMGLSPLLNSGIIGGRLGSAGGGGARIEWIDVHRASALDRTLLVERHLISKEHARGPVHAKAVLSSGAAVASPDPVGEPRGVAVSLPDETLSVMVNEEDHLRLQVIRSGLELNEAYEHVNRVDDVLESGGTTVGGGGAVSGGGLEYAFSPRFGYLTACPTNVGTGIRVSVMLHLPALKLVGEMDKVRRATRDMSLAVRGFYGEGSEAAGELYQISNQTTLGKPESIILHEFEREILPQVINYERTARRMLMDKRRRLVEDKVFRALGTLRYARLLTPEEALTLLSDVRLGILCGLITDVPEVGVNQLILLTQPAHLQRALGGDLDQNQRREARADLVRASLTPHPSGNFTGMPPSGRDPGEGRRAGGTGGSTPGPLPPTPM